MRPWKDRIQDPEVRMRFEMADRMERDKSFVVRPMRACERDPDASRMVVISPPKHEMPVDVRLEQLQNYRYVPMRYRNELWYAPGRVPGRPFMDDG